MTARSTMRARSRRSRIVGSHDDAGDLVADVEDQCLHLGDGLADGADGRNVTDTASRGARGAAGTRGGSRGVVLPGAGARTSWPVPPKGGSRADMIDEGYAMDEVNAAAFQTAYRHLLETCSRLGGEPRNGG